MAKETGSGSKPTADTKSAAKEAAAKYNPPASSSSSSSSSKSSSTASKPPVSSGSIAAKASAARVAQSLSSSGGGSSSSGGGPPSVRASTASPRTTNSLTQSLVDRMDASSRGMAEKSSPERARKAYASLDSYGKKSRMSPNPAAGEVEDIGRQLQVMQALGTEARQREALQKKREEMDPVSGFFYDPWTYLFPGPDTPDTSAGPGSMLENAYSAAQAPYEKRAQRAGGAPFEGPVDWEGIGAALFGGQSAAERDAALAAQRRGPDPSRFTPLGEENLGLSYGMLNDMYRPEIDPESGFIRDPDTGTFYPPGSPQLSSSPIRLAESVPAATQLPGLFAPLEGLVAGIQAEGRRLNGEVDPSTVPLPRPRPAGAPQGIEAMAIPLPGQTESPDGVIDITVPYEGESDEARYARNNPVKEPEKKSVWDQVVEGAGGLAEKTGWGSVVKSLFPDFWYGTGEAMKGMDDGVRYGGSGVRTNFEDTANGGSLIEQPVQYAYAPAMLPFPDVNGNGIDDRLEGLSAVNGNNRPRTAVFPTMPPFRPGIDAEWQYFRDGYAEGGMVGGSDPLAAMENILTLFAQGELSAKDTQKALRPFGYKANLRSKYGNTVELEPLGTGDFVTLKFAEGGMVDTDLDEPVNSGNLHRDPRMALIADAEDAIENYAEGEPEPDDETALRKFVEAFGDGALRELAANVQQGLKLRERRTGRLVRGPGGPKDDAIPAVITEEGGRQRPAALSDGEFVMNYDAVAGAGDGDHDLGAERLQRLSNMMSRRAK